MNTTEHPLAAEPEDLELSAGTENRAPLSDPRKPYVVPALMEPQDMLETTKFFFQVGTGGSGTG